MSVKDLQRFFDIAARGQASAFRFKDWSPCLTSPEGEFVKRYADSPLFPDHISASINDAPSFTVEVEMVNKPRRRAK